MLAVKNMALLPFSSGGSVTKISVTTANGVSGTVANSTTTPAISLTLGAITPTSVNSVVLSGASTPTLAVTGTSSISGSNTGDQTITLTGNVTGSGTGSFATTIANLAVTNAMIAASTIDLTAKVTGVLPLLNGGTASTTGSITGSGALTFTAGGTNQNVTLTPSGTGYTLLNGNVGIGTTGPTYPLDISAIGTNGFQEQISSSGSDTGIRLTNTTAGGRSWGLDSAGTGSGAGNVGGFNIFDITSSISRFSLTSSGNVGIGTTAPQTTLDINGGMRTLTNAQSAAYQILVTDSTIYVTTGTTVGMAITLPAASANTVGLYFFVYKVDSGVGTVAITPTGTNTLNGVNATKSIANQWNGALIRGLTATSWLVTSFTGL